MSISNFHRVAINTISNCFGDKCKCVAITTSNKDIEITDVVIEFSKSMAAMDKKIKLLDLEDVNDFGKLAILNASNGIVEHKKLIKSEDKDDFLSDIKVRGIIDEMSRDIDYLIISCGYIQKSQAGMFFAANSDGVILIEQKKLSRKDEIDDTMIVLNSLNAKSIGFILL